MTITPGALLERGVDVAGTWSQESQLLSSIYGDMIFPPFSSSPSSSSSLLLAKIGPHSVAYIGLNFISSAGPGAHALVQAGPDCGNSLLPS